MALKEWTPPTPDSFVSFVKVDFIDTLATMRTQGHYDKLCGAAVRYGLTGVREDVPHSIEAAYAGCLAHLDHMRQGAKNKRMGDDGGTSESETSQGQVENDMNYDVDNLSNTLTSQQQVNDLSTTSHAQVNDKSCTSHDTSDLTSNVPASPVPAQTPSSLGGSLGEYPMNMYMNMTLSNGYEKREDVCTTSGSDTQLDASDRMLINTQVSKLTALDPIHYPESLVRPWLEDVCANHGRDAVRDMAENVVGLRRRGLLFDIRSGRTVDAETGEVTG